MSPNVNFSTGIDNDVVAGRGWRPVHLVLLGLAVLTLVRLWYATRLQLVPDEAYYWLWSKHLAASYRDKGPLVAWVIAVGRLLFGDTVFGIRVMGVLLGTGTAWQLYVLARRLYDERTAMWCIVVALVIPIFAVGSILMTIDSPSVFCWAWAANLFWIALETGRTRDWVLVGMALGLGFLAKFTNGVQLAGFGLFLLWSRPHRHLLLSRQTVAMGLAFAVCLLPILWWNIQTGWVHYLALHERSGVEGSFRIRPIEVWHYLGAELGVLSPLLPIGMVVAAIGLWRQHGSEARVKHLLTQFVPVQALFLFFSLNKAGEANWIAPSLVAGIILLVVYWRDLAERRPRWRIAVWTAMVLAAVMTAALHVMPFIGLPPRLNPLKRAQGWPVFVEHLQKARQQYHPDVLLARHYSHASIMQFYLPDQPVTYLPPEPYGANQFTLWPTYVVRPGIKGLFVTEGPEPPPAVLEKQFRKVTLVDDFWSQENGRPIYQFRIFLLSND